MGRDTQARWSWYKIAVLGVALSAVASPLQWLIARGVVSCAQTPFTGGKFFGAPLVQWRITNISSGGSTSFFFVPALINLVFWACLFMIALAPFRTRQGRVAALVVPALFLLTAGPAIMFGGPLFFRNLLDHPVFKTSLVVATDPGGGDYPAGWFQPDYGLATCDGGAGHE